MRAIIGCLCHAAHLGLPIPQALKDVLEQLHDRAEKSGEPDYAGKHSSVEKIDSEPNAYGSESRKDEQRND